MFKYVVVMLALVMVKVGNGTPNISPVSLDRVGIEVDLKKDPRGNYQFSGTGTILMEQILSYEGEKASDIGSYTSKVCRIPVTVDVPGEIPGLNEALTQQLRQIAVNSGLEGEIRKDHFKSNFFGFSKGQAHNLTSGTLEELLGRYTFRLAAQLKGVDTTGVTGVVNDSGVGMVLPIGTDFNRFVIVDIGQVPATPLSKDAFCEVIRAQGYVIKK